MSELDGQPAAGAADHAGDRIDDDGGDKTGVAPAPSPAAGLPRLSEPLIAPPTPVRTPYAPAAPAPPLDPLPSPPGSRSRVLLIAAGLGVLLAGAVAAGAAAMFGTHRSTPSMELPSGALSQAMDAPMPAADDAAAASPATGDTDLGLSVPMSYPRCDGSGIVVLGNVVPPRRSWQDAAAGVQRLLEDHPGASYLRTDNACPSLRQADEAGNPIYAVFRVAGRSKSEVCAAVRAAGGDAYGKWLDTATPATYIIPC